MSALTTPDDYELFCEGLRQICGIDLSQYRRPQMERRLRAFFTRQGVERLADALPQLRSDPAALDLLLDRLTINVSALWRHPTQVAHLEETVIPELLTAGRLRAWSAGCSYGAEAFTVAAVCEQAQRAGAGRGPISVLGTDIDRRMIARAKLARFSAEDVRDVPPAVLARTFQRDGDWWVPSDALRRVTRFEAGDLLRIEPPAGAYDLVLCRNTVIYFSGPVRDALHERLARALRPGGYLLIGATERVADPGACGLVPTAPFFYRRMT